MSEAIARTKYDQNRDFCIIPKFVHSGIYTSFLRLVGELSATIEGRQMRAFDTGCERHSSHRRSDTTRGSERLAACRLRGCRNGAEHADGGRAAEAMMRWAGPRSN